MGIFNSILEKLGLKKEQETAAAKPAEPKSNKDSRPVPPSIAAAPKPAVGTPIVGKPVVQAKPEEPKSVKEVLEEHLKGAAAAKAAEPKPVPMEMVDVMSKLEKMSHGTGLDWKVSIVDLLKLLKIDSSLEARKELAVELGCPPELMNESRNMNIWLHKTVLKKIAENGGNIPKELLD